MHSIWFFVLVYCCDMEIIQLTATNIEQYLDDCVLVQKYLVTPEEIIEPERFIATASDLNNYLIGVVENGHIVGMGEITKIVHPVRIVGYINNIVVHEDYRGKGIFSLIMNALEVKAKEWGCGKVNLTCSRVEVQPLYEKRGYVERKTKFYTLHTK